MANSYLMQSLYDPNSPAPAVKSEAPVSEEGEIREQNETTNSEHYIHDARRQLIESNEEPIEVDRQVDQCWKPTGANKQPIGIKSESPAARYDQGISSFPSFLHIETPAPLPPLLVNTAHKLRYPVERYLPPAGIYYDQLALPTVFGTHFFKKECCKVCWIMHYNPVGGSATSCGKKCQVCGTSRHKHESCPLLYCSAQWYHERCVPHRPKTLYDRQIRPEDDELAIMCEIGVLDRTRGPNGIIIAKPDHPVVKAFYDGRPDPQPMTTRIMDTERKPRSVFTTTAEGFSFVPNVQSQQTLSLRKRPFSLPSTTVNNSLDPYLRDPYTPTYPARHESIQHKIVMDQNDITTTNPLHTEDKLQEQEIEILKLKMEAAIKDREVRKLKAENDALKLENEKLRIYPISTGGTFETGSKRSRSYF
ncbi:hypothetical protein GT037_000303 [Alternaria burnsii]|uniref:Uncharacterized protein n=1 Tax=Alternaria burnsii TaxID=1187904 RepID=A0A8H7BB34_9PLEO|nr:uncharacterized protein GT037_000303 [Alternaria burnsii]KAF7681327.1 hypothetical protein GT037_000303 [Alternaria burnsii]